MGWMKNIFHKKIILKNISFPRGKTAVMPRKTSGSLLYGTKNRYEKAQASVCLSKILLKKDLAEKSTFQKSSHCKKNGGKTHDQKA